MIPVVLLSLLRSSEGLFAWVGNDPGYEEGALLSRIALAELAPALCPQRDALLADWQSLGTAKELEQVWPAFWRVFWGTLSDPRDQAPPAMPQRVAPPAPPSATAAHPRAFRGTKFQPPKPPVPALDLCAWLSDDRLLDGFFARHDFARLPALDADGRPLVPASAPTVAGLLALPAVPETFRRTFMWRLRMLPPRELLAWLQVWRGLGSPQHGLALILAARLCALEPGAHAWAGLALGLAPPRQIIFLKALLGERAYRQPFGALSASQLSTLDADTGEDQRFDLYLNALFSNLSRQVSAAYTLCGCTIANRVIDSHRREAPYLRVRDDCTDVPMADIFRMSQAVGADRRFWERSAWEDCGKLPGFDKVLRETSWEKLGADAADQWLALFAYMDWDEDDEKVQTHWRALLSLFPEWNRGLNSLSGAWQEKYVRMLRSYTTGWEDSEALRRSVPYLLPLQLRFCQPPYSASSDGDSILSPMARHVPAESWQQLATTGERTWLIVERACRRDNDSGLIARGLSSLGLCWPAFLMQAFAAVPKRLLRTAQLLGCLAYERRRQFLAEASHNAWFSTKWEEMAPYEACLKLSRLCTDTGVHSPVPRRLRDHFEGRTTLTPQQVERHCRVTLAQLATVLLAALEAAIWGSIDAPYDLRAQSATASHAVRLLAGLTDNRRGLRRFLQAYRQGRADAYLDHPLNRAWFARHPRIDAHLWASNPLSLKACSTGDIHLALETDPLEILMLGTYVGSCLGLGGLCDYSAVACLLDANKQVIYARDGSGRVLARQLVGIDESDRLVCFGVYPMTASKELVSAFHAFDLALGQALGIDLYRNEDKGNEYQIDTIVAQSWWDDGVQEAGYLAETVAPGTDLA